MHDNYETESECFEGMMRDIFHVRGSTKPKLSGVASLAVD